MLNFVDVRITPQESSRCIEISTSDRAYALTRKCLITLKDEAGLPVTLHSEEVGAVCSDLPRHQNGSGTSTLTITEDLPVRFENKFLIVAWQINVRECANLNALSEEIAVQLRQFGLTCNVFPIDSNA